MARAIAVSISMRSPFFPFVVVLLALPACGSKVLTPPISDNQSDDPCDPGSGSNITGPAPPVDAGAAPVPMPGTPPGIGFDDLRFSGTLSLLLIPAGRTGNLDFVDPSSETVTSVGGFSTENTYGGDDSFGVTSADEGNAIVYATDRTSNTLAVIDPKQKTIVAKASLAATPGYVRYVAPTSEVWVTEPSTNQIEVFSLGSSETVAPTHSTFISTKGGLADLEIDAVGKRAYANTTSATVVIDVPSHAIIDTWSNGCTTSRGLAIDPTQGWVIPVCEEGMVVVLSTQGATIGTTPVGAGVDQVAYDAQRTRLYVPGPAASAMSVVTFASNGVPSVAGSIQTASDAHCAVTPGGGAVYVCAPSLGDLLFVQDPF